MQHSHGESLRTTGFSEQVDLGVMGPVKQDPSIVMRVELPDSPGTPAARGPLYLRGVAYNRYDGKSWSNNLLHRRMLTELPKAPSRSEHRAPNRRPRHAHSDKIFCWNRSIRPCCSAPPCLRRQGRLPLGQSDLMGSLHLAFPSHSRIQYTVYSVPTSLNPAERAAAAVLYPEFILQQYLQIPPSARRSLTSHSMSRSRPPASPRPLP